MHGAPNKPREEGRLKLDNYFIRELNANRDASNCIIVDTITDQDLKIRHHEKEITLLILKNMNLESEIIKLIEKVYALERTVKLHKQQQEAIVDAIKHQDLAISKCELQIITLMNKNTQNENAIIEIIKNLEKIVKIFAQKSKL